MATSKQSPSNPYVESAARRKQRLEELGGGGVSQTALASEASGGVVAAPPPTAPAPAVKEPGSTQPAAEIAAAEPPVVVPSRVQKRRVSSKAGQIEDEVSAHTVYLRRSDDERYQRIVGFMRSNRRHLRSRWRGITAVCRAALEVLDQELLRDPESALLALNRALPRPRSDADIDG